MQPVCDKVDIQIFYHLFEQDDDRLSYYMELFHLDSTWDMLYNINELLREEVYERTKT